MNILSSLSSIQRIDPNKIEHLDLNNAFRIELKSKLIKISTHFFYNPEPIPIPFRGFIIQGPPGNGKTELIKQIFLEIYNSDKRVECLFVDSSDIAAARWGDAETNIKKIFHQIDPNKKIIILFEAFIFVLAIAIYFSFGDMEI